MQIRKKYNRPKSFEQPHRKLTCKQRVQIRIRKIRPLPLPVCLSVVAALFLLLTIVPNLLPSLVIASAVAAPDYDTVLTIDFVGDIMLGRYIADLGEKSGYDSLFSGVTGYWKNADLAVANLESAVLSDSVSSYTATEKEIHLYCSQTALNVAIDAGINMFACANNHTFDYGERPIIELIDYFSERGILYSGIGETIEDAATYTLTEMNAITIAFISISDVYYAEAEAGEDSAGLLTTAYNGFEELVYDASCQADLTIVYMHWGEEDEIIANREQKNLGHQLIDAGADIVIGSHPHVLQEVELYRDGIIFYSLGNFIFDQGNTYSKDTVIVQYTLSSDGTGAFELIPFRSVNGTPTVTKNSFYRARINRKLSRGLEQSSYYYNENGNMIIPAINISVPQESTSEIEAGA